jgi:signal transduction histidine kinase/CheY-like chemotaxis protein
MKLKRQLLGVFYASAVAAVLVGTVVVYQILTPAVLDFEDAAAHKELARVESAFLQTFSTLYARTRDWAEMARVEALVEGRSDVVPMVPGQSADNLRIDKVVVFSESGGASWLRGQPEQLDNDVRQLYQTFSERACYPVWGVTTISGEYYVFAMHPMAECGAALFAIALDERLSMELSGITGLDFRLRPAEAGSGQGRETRITRVDGETLVASFPVMNYLQEPALRGEVLMPREIFKRGPPLISALAGVIIMIALVTATLLYVFVQRRVFRRLGALHQAVRGIAQGGDLSQRIAVDGGDELAELATDFNAMIDHINDAQQSLARASERAESANRAKSLFLANMSHEIRTPMTAILGYTELLEHSALSEEESNRYLAIIQQNGDALMALISDVLDLSRIEAGQVRVERQACDLPHLMKDILNSHMLRAKQKNISLTLQYSSSVPREITTDAFRLRQILTNLVGNAIKFTDQGGVSVNVSWREGDRAGLQVQVYDSGIGIPASALPLVFEPFSQVDESHTRRFGGSGLGLAIARQLSRSLGGDISVTSVPQQGSTFTLTISAGIADGSALVLPEEALVLEQKSLKLPAIKATGRVLVVDDNQVNRLLVMRILDRAGFQVSEAEHGKEALDSCVDGDPFDLIVLDMQMPVMDGFEAATALRERGYRGPILALTANVMAEDRRRCLQAGCDDFLGKPVRAKRLLGACVRLMTELGNV